MHPIGPAGALLEQPDIACSKTLFLPGASMTDLPRTSSNATQVPSLTSYPTKALPVRSDFRTRAVLATLMLVTGSVFCGRPRPDGDPPIAKTVSPNHCSPSPPP